MPTFKPFKGIRPNIDFIDCFPTHPIDNFSEEELLQKSNEETSYIKMIKPYICNTGECVEINLELVRENFEELIDKRKLIQDSHAYYLYKQTMPDKTVFRGLLGLVSVDDFQDGKIKKHEETITQKKHKFAQYLGKVNLQAEPVLLTYNSNSKVELFMNNDEKNIPIINCTDKKGINHKVWKIDNSLKVQQYREVLELVDSFYIADGHHRIGSTAIHAEEKKGSNKSHDGMEGYNYIYSFIVSNQSIKIHDYNRLIKDLNNLSVTEFIEKVSQFFNIQEKGETPYFPSQKAHISMYLDNTFYSLQLKPELKSEKDGLENLDHYVLEKYLLNPILGIDDSKASDRIDFIKGNSSIESILKIKEKIDSGKFKIGFGLHPVGFNNLLQLANENLKMPPKCTYIEPKPMTALVMYDMKEK